MNTIILVLDNEKFQVDERFANLSELAKDLRENMVTQEIPLEKDLISKQCLFKIIEYCQNNDFQAQKINRPVRTNKLDKVVSQIDYKFIKDYDFLSEDLQNLYYGANYLQIQSLLDLIYAKVACEFYFGEKQSDYDNLLVKFKIKSDITVDQGNEYCEQEEWLKEF